MAFPKRLSVVLIVIVASAVAAFSMPKATAGNESREGLTELTTCVASARALDVLVLLDTSGSLKDTDPGGRRVDATKTALASLELLQRESSGRDPITVNVALAGFGSNYVELEPWQVLDEGSLQRLENSVESFRERNTDIDTDYLLALEDAAESLRGQRDRASQPDSCQVILWFTDGAYDIQTRDAETSARYGATKDYAPDADLATDAGAEEAEARGKSLLCDTGGAVDQLRLHSIHLIALGLTTGINTTEQGYLEAIAEGSGGSSTCGTSPVPTGSAAGLYLPVDDVSDLTLGLFDAVNRVAGGTEAAEGTVPVCRVQSCPQGRLPFTIVRGLRSFRLLAITGAPDVAIELRSPEQVDALPIVGPDSGSGPLGSALVTWQWPASDTASIEVVLPDGDGPWIGEWSVTFVDTTGSHPDALARTKIFVFGDIIPVLDGEPTFRRAETSTFAGRLETAAGTPSDRAAFSSLPVTAKLIDPITGTTQRLDVRDEGDQFTGKWDVPRDFASGSVTLELTVEPVTTAGFSLAPVTRSYEVQVQPPAQYPRVITDELHLASTGDGPPTGSIEVVGAETTGGCVWLEAGQFEQRPSGVESVSATSNATQDSCLPVGPGQTVALTVSATPHGAADGLVRGSVRVGLQSDDDLPPLYTEVPTSFNVNRPVDEGVRLGWFVGLLVAGLVIPLALLLVLNKAIGRFTPPQEMWIVTRECLVTKTGITTPEEEPFQIASDDFKRFPGTADAPWQFSVDDVQFRSPTVLLRQPFGLASKPEHLVLAMGDGESQGIGKETRVPLQLGGTLLVLIPGEHADTDKEDAPIEASVLAFAETRHIELRRKALNEQLASRGESLYLRAKVALRERNPGQTGDNSPPTEPPENQPGTSFPSKAPGGHPEASGSSSPPTPTPPSSLDS